ncbi:MAG: asparagine synthase (glutamine-hydrolyzing), partial [Coprobacillus sp.]
MCGIVTICNYTKNLLELDEKLKRMSELLVYRGPNHEGYSLSKHCLMAHRRLSIIDLENGNQPMSYTKNGRTYRITYNGEIYNMMDIKKQLINLGYIFETTSDTEVVLASYVEYQENCLDLFEGVFAFVIDDGEKLFIARDQLGVKPLFYYQDEATIVIASEIKCILEYIGKAVVDVHGVKELLGLGPSLSPGYTLYKDIYSLRPGYYMYFDGQCDLHCYWKLHDEKHTDNLEETIHHVKELVIDSIQKQLLSDVPVSSMLSGGLDSSIVTAVAAQYIQPLATYSISYEDQEKYFQAYEYQTTMDDDYIQEMVKQYHPQHNKIVLKQTELIDGLKEALIARDMPGMADVDSSLLLFSQSISQNHKVALSGECADEIFGGYPWFYKEEL